MENNTSTSQSGSSTKHSLLSAQADLNTGTGFHADTVTPVASTVVLPPTAKPLPSGLEDSAHAFSERMKMEHANSVSSLQAAKMSTDTSQKNTTPAMTRTESAFATTSSFTGMNTARAQVEHTGAPLHGSTSGVVFEDSVPSGTSASSKKSSSIHAYTLYISIFVILAILFGGVYYWYAFMGGKAMFKTQDVPKVKTAEPVAPSKPVQQNTFPAAAKPATTTKASPQMNTSVFAPVAHTASVPDTQKKAMFGSAEKEIVASYVVSNINKLSPIKSSIGYSVDDVRFDGSDKLLVSYGDGNTSLSAIVYFTIDSKKIVKVTSFNILEK